MALEPVEGLRILDTYGNPRMMTLLNTRPIHPIDVISGNAAYPEVSRVISKVKGSGPAEKVGSIDQSSHLAGVPLMGSLKVDL